MTRIEKRAAILLFILSILIAGIRIAGVLESRTRIIPASGGEYREAVVGELKYLNPLLAQTDVDKATSSLIFPGLVKFSGGQILPDIAERWEISDDGQKYTFILNKEVVFHDGAKLTANDVYSTIELIKSENEDGTKSWLYDAWRDVEIEVEDNYRISFLLPKPYGPFIYNCGFGILPAHIPPDELSSRFIGSGPFQFDSTISANHIITQLKLKRSENYYGGKPYLEKLNFIFYADKTAALKALGGKEVEALSGTAADSLETVLNLSYKSSRRLGLIFNLRSEKVKDKETRRKIIAGEKLSEPLQLTLTTRDGELQHTKAEEIKNALAGQNIDLAVSYLNPVRLKEALDTRNYELLLYGFDFGYDRDPYVFWHSSQLDKANFAGFSDKTSDILLEDARMLANDQERNAKYDLFFDTIKNESLAVFYDPIRYFFYVDPKLKGTTAVKGHEACSRYEDIAKWYLKEKKVKMAASP